MQGTCGQHSPASPCSLWPGTPPSHLVRLFIMRASAQQCVFANRSPVLFTPPPHTCRLGAMVSKYGNHSEGFTAFVADQVRHAVFLEVPCIPTLQFTHFVSSYHFKPFTATFWPPAPPGHSSSLPPTSYAAQTCLAPLPKHLTGYSKCIQQMCCTCPAVKCRSSRLTGCV